MEPWPDHFHIASDYRTEIIVDWDNPILAFKANRERYTQPSKNEGLPHLGNPYSDDAITWNIFRSLQKAGSLDIITDKIGIGKPRGLLIWSLAPELGGDSIIPKSPESGSVNSRLQYITGNLLRKSEGVLPGQIDEPDVVILGATGVAVGVVCKQPELNEARNPWKSKVNQVRHLIMNIKKYEKRHRDAQEKTIIHGENSSSLRHSNTNDANEKPNSNNGKHDILKDGTREKEVVPVYQLLKMALLAKELGNYFNVEPVVVAIANTRTWSSTVLEGGKSASGLWKTFTGMLGENSPRCEIIFWQHLNRLMSSKSLPGLRSYLVKRPSLYDVGPLPWDSWEA